MVHRAAREDCTQVQAPARGRRSFVRWRDGQPSETGAIVFGIYSHGDCHPAGGANASDEWFAHFPYVSTRSDIYDFVATEGAKDAGVGKNRPDNYLYSTQLRIIFHQI